MPAPARGGRPSRAIRALAHLPDNIRAVSAGPLSTLDNIMTGRNRSMKAGLFWQALRSGPGPGRRGRFEHPAKGGEAHHRSPGDPPAIPAKAARFGRPAPYGMQRRAAVKLGFVRLAPAELGCWLDEAEAGA